MLDFAWSLAAFVVTIGLLVSFHEFGHFWVARKLGVKVLRFSVGFGKPLWLRRGRDGVEYVLAAIPLGGYVKMMDEREGIVPPAELGRAFNRQPVGKRIAIVAAGPAFNLLLAIVAYWMVFVAGVSGVRPVLAEPPAASAAAQAGLREGDEVLRLHGREVASWQALRTELIDAALNAERLSLDVRDAQGGVRGVELSLADVRVDPEFLFGDLGLLPYDPPIPAVLAEVVPGDPAEAAGIRAGDRLLSFNGAPIESWQQWAQWLRAHPGEVVKLRVQRGAETLEAEVIVARDASGVGRFGARVEVPAGLWDNLRAEHRLGAMEALPAAVAQTWNMSVLTIKMLYRMVLGDVSVKNVSGPIQIAQIAGYSASVGLVSFLSFLAIVSVSLAVLNLLPVPVLDGGHLLYYLVELVKGSPLSEKAQAVGQQIGLTLLLLLMGLAFYNDIQRLIG